MVFSLAALGAGLGQFAQDYRQQQAQQERNLMLKMQLANWQREMDKDRREGEAGAIAVGLGGGGRGSPFSLSSPQFGSPQPQGVPGGLSALTGPMPGSGTPSTMSPGAGALGEYGQNQTGLGTLRSLAQQVAGTALPAGYSVAETSGSRPGARVAGTGGVSQHALDNALDLQIVGPQGPIPNTGEDTTGMYGRLALAMRQAAPPDIASRLGWGGNFTTGPANGPRDLMHFDLAGDRGRYGTLTQMAQAGGGQPGQGGTTPDQAGSIARGFTGAWTAPGGTQVAQTGGVPPGLTPARAQQAPQMPTSEPAPPREAKEIFEFLRAKYPTTDSRTLTQAAVLGAQQEKERYKADIELWKARTGFVQTGQQLQETGRHNTTQEDLERQKIAQEIRRIDETITAGTATREDLLKKRDLEERKFGLDKGRLEQEIRRVDETITAGTATRGDLENKIRLQTELQAENAQHHRAQEQGAAASLKARVGVQQGKVSQGVQHLETLANEAEQLAQMVEADHSLVGVRGIGKRRVGDVLSQLGIGEADQSQTLFKSKMEALRAQIRQPMLDTRYFSKASQDRLEQLLPGLERWEGPGQVITSLRNTAGIMRDRAAAVKAATGAVSEDVSKITDDALRQEFGGQ